MFNLSHEHKLTGDMGTLMPCCAMEVLPGDSFIHSSSAMARIAPLANPVMHRVEMRIHHFYVPNRLVWSGWEGFITGREETTVPTIDMSGLGSDELILPDHMGVDPGYTGDVQALPFRCYNMIWNEYYRDQDLNTARAEDDMTLARICWEKDYFTVARPEPQQGTAEQIPMALDAELQVFRNNPPTGDQVHSDVLAVDATGVMYAGSAVNGNNRLVARNYAGGGSTAGIDINDLRRSMAYQRIAEARAMYGERYIDYLRFLGVNPSDGRLDRPEYLGGGKQIINFSEVLATAEGANTDVGDMFGHGIGAARSRRYRRMFEEHGWVLSLLSFRPKTVYQDGTPRRFTRSTAMDYWQKELEILPWQEVKTAEISPSGTTEDVFGYVPRYEEYRMENSRVSGSFRRGTEEDWHLARTFGSTPTLNGSFVECTPSDRVYQDTNMPEVIVNVRNSILAKRLVRGTAQIGAL